MNGSIPPPPLSSCRPARHRVCPPKCTRKWASSAKIRSRSPSLINTNDWKKHIHKREGRGVADTINDIHRAARNVIEINVVGAKTMIKFRQTFYANLMRCGRRPLITLPQHAPRRPPPTPKSKRAPANTLFRCIITDPARALSHHHITANQPPAGDAVVDRAGEFQRKMCAKPSKMGGRATIIMQGSGRRSIALCPQNSSNLDGWN